MAKPLDSKTKNAALELRIAGYSLLEIATKLRISKSTSSLWLKNVELNSQAKARIEKIRELARTKAAKTIKDRIRNRRKIFDISANNILSELKISKNPSLSKVLCSLLYWGEGSKTGYRVAFINSDPAMIATFIKLLRLSFTLDESKFRALVHIHEYHNEAQIKNYWSNITGIPLSQFTKSYLKPHTKKVIRQDYKGALRIAYADTKIVDELKAVYNGLAKSLGMW